ncbi:MAG: fibronectin type III domain-containing protein [Bryobacterales bacterium]|nr:fibronectin type III domain-containing protein [Bryobacterales bacterium]
MVTISLIDPSKTVPPKIDPAAPSRPTIEALLTDLRAASSDQRVTLHWQGHGLRGGYQTRLSADGGATWSAWVALPEGSPAGPKAHTADGLENGKQYLFQVRAVGSSGSPRGVKSVRAAAGLPARPDPPSTAAHDGRIAIEGRLGAAHFSPLQAYLWRDLSAGTVRVADRDGSRWRATADGLSNGTRYGFAAQALNEFGAGPPSLAAENAPTDALPAAPRGLAAISGSRGGRSLVTLRWGQDLDASAAPGGELAGSAGEAAYEYRSRRRGAQAWPRRWTAVPGGGAARAAELTGLWFGEFYDFEVRATGEQSPGAVSAATVTVALPAARLGALAAAWTHAGQVELTWASSSSRPGAYEYRSSTDGGATWDEWSAAVASCESNCRTMVPVSGAGVHRYRFQLRRVGRRGTAEAWTGTHPDAPQAPSLAKPAQSGADPLTLRWSSAASGNPATAWEYRSVFLDAPTAALGRLGQPCSRPPSTPALTSSRCSRRKTHSAASMPSKCAAPTLTASAPVPTSRFGHARLRPPGAHAV